MKDWLKNLWNKLKVMKTDDWLQVAFSPLGFFAILAAITFLVWLSIPSWIVEEEVINEVTGESETEKRTVLSSSTLAGMLFGLFWITSFRFRNPVQEDQIAVKLCFGRPFGEIGSGLPFAPWLLVELRRIGINYEQPVYPAPPEKIWRPTEDQMGETPPPDFKPPIRITFGEAATRTEAKRLLGSVQGQNKYDDSGKPIGDKTEEDDFLDAHSYYRFADRMPDEGLKSTTRLYTFETHVSPSLKKQLDQLEGLDRRVTAEVELVLRYRVVRGKGTNLITNIGDKTKVEQQAGEEMVGILQRLLPNMSVGQALQNIGLINAILKYKVRVRTWNWGIEVDDAYLKLIQFHRTLNQAIAKRGQAYFEATAEKERLTREGEGTAAAAAAHELGVLEARAKGYQTISLTIGVAGAEVQANETGRAIGEGEGTVVIGTDGFRDLVGIGKAIAAKKGGDS